MSQIVSRKRHKTTVIINGTGPNPGKYQAWCVCGWESEPHTAYPLAAATADQHQQETEQ